MRNAAPPTPRSAASPRFDEFRAFSPRPGSSPAEGSPALTPRSEKSPAASLHAEPSADSLDLLLAEFRGASVETTCHGLISVRPTPHLVRLSNRMHCFTWCALDTLLVARLLECDASIESVPPGCEAPLRFEITAGTVRASDQWILSFPDVLTESGDHFTDAFCPYANVFESFGSYREWAPRQPRGTAPLSLFDADRTATEWAARVRERAPRASARTQANTCSQSA